MKIKHGLSLIPFDRLPLELFHENRDQFSGALALNAQISGLELQATSFMLNLQKIQRELQSWHMYFHSLQGVFYGIDVHDSDFKELIWNRLEKIALLNELFPDVKIVIGAPDFRKIDNAWDFILEEIGNISTKYGVRFYLENICTGLDDCSYESNFIGFETGVFSGRVIDLANFLECNHLELSQVISQTYEFSHISKAGHLPPMNRNEFNRLIDFSNDFLVKDGYLWEFLNSESFFRFSKFLNQSK